MNVTVKMPPEMKSALEKLAKTEFSSVSGILKKAADKYLQENGIDWKNVAWTHLGTAARMKQLGKWITRAQALARTPQEKRRVALWHDALWKWMEDGRAEYLAQ